MAERKINKLMGTRVIIDIGLPLNGSPPAEEKIEQIVDFLYDYQARLSRFNPNSELNALNNDPNQQVEVSPLLADAIQAALDASEMSSGLVDPTLLSFLESAGYQESWDNQRQIDLAEAVERLPDRRGEANPDSPWRQISVDGLVVSRPPGVKIEIGGSGKGLAADLAANLVDGLYQDWLINLGGDMRLGGERPRQVEIISPFDNQVVDVFPVQRGAVATSGIDSRLWSREGKVYHHLLDPASGEPVFSGIVAATAYGASAVEAEVKAKMALMRGVDEAEDILIDGGVIILADGQVCRLGRLARRRIKSIRLPQTN